MAKLNYLRSFFILTGLMLVMLLSISWVHAEEAEWIPVTGRPADVSTVQNGPVLSSGFAGVSQPEAARSAPGLAILFSSPTEAVPAPAHLIQSISLPTRLPQPAAKVALWFGGSMLVVAVSAVSIFWVRRTSL